MVILSPKFHPEIAGCGIEYCWGAAKMRFRNRHNNLLARDLKSNVLKCFVPDEMRRSGVMAYARRTRDHIHSCTTQVEDYEVGEILSKNDIEKMRKIH